MITTNSYKPQRVLEAISKHLGIPGNPQQLESGVLFYLGAGYWRLIISEDWQKFSLANSDKTFEEIRCVERAISIIEHLGYEP